MKPTSLDHLTLQQKAALLISKAAFLFSYSTSAFYNAITTSATRLVRMNRPLDVLRSQ